MRAAPRHQGVTLIEIMIVVIAMLAPPPAGFGCGVRVTNEDWIYDNTTGVVAAP